MRNWLRAELKAVHDRFRQRLIPLLFKEIELQVKQEVAKEVEKQLRLQSATADVRLCELAEAEKEEAAQGQIVAEEPPEPAEEVPVQNANEASPVSAAEEELVQIQGQGQDQGQDQEQLRAVRYGGRSPVRTKLEQIAQLLQQLKEDSVLLAKKAALHDEHERHPRCQDGSLDMRCSRKNKQLTKYMSQQEINKNEGPVEAVQQA
jgi:hypothetical protein